MYRTLARLGTAAAEVMVMDGLALGLDVFVVLVFAADILAGGGWRLCTVV